MAEKFLVMWNMPGCLPEMDPVPFELDDFDGAKRYVIDELLRSADDAGEFDDETAAETYAHTAEDVNLESGLFTTPCMPDGYVYSVVRGE